ncbi:hypothetical protein PRIPAC_86194, partial [Pristionchus pacificus]|uniref:Uncharacterized protein n=1 Tax=Pristionchus pacificus TaxID=54126 RepID=A0A2A6BUU2_PRIPA
SVPTLAIKDGEETQLSGKKEGVEPQEETPCHSLPAPEAPRHSPSNPPNSPIRSRVPPTIAHIDTGVVEKAVPADPTSTEKEKQKALRPNHYIDPHSLALIQKMYDEDIREIDAAAKSTSSSSNNMPPAARHVTKPPCAPSQETDWPSGDRRGGVLRHGRRARGQREKKELHKGEHRHDEEDDECERPRCLARRKKDMKGETQTYIDFTQENGNTEHGNTGERNDFIELASIVHDAGFDADAIEFYKPPSSKPPLNLDDITTL